MLQLLKITEGKLIAFKAIGNIKKSDYEKIDSLVEETLRDHYKIRMFIQLMEMDGLSFESFLKDLKARLKHTEKIERIAIVTADSISKDLSDATPTLFPADLKIFNIEEFIDAERWIMI